MCRPPTLRLDGRGTAILHRPFADINRVDSRATEDHEHRPCRAQPRNAAPFASCTRPDASSSPIRGTSAPRAISSIWASRRSPPPARALRFRAASPTRRFRATTCWRISREIVAAADLPVNADFEGGYAHEPEGVAESVRLCVATGVAGLSIEDSTGDKDKPLYDLDLAVARIKAARAAIDQAGGDVLLTGRAECFLVGRPDLDETIRRLKAYAEAGADCLYAPGIRTREQIAAVVQAAAPQAGQLPDAGRARAHGRRSRRARRAPHQRRRHARARRLRRASSAPPRRSPTKAASTPSRTRCRMPSSTRSSATT